MVGVEVGEALEVVIVMVVMVVVVVVVAVVPRPVMRLRTDFIDLA